MMLWVYLLVLVSWAAGDQNASSYSRLVFEDNFSHLDLGKWDHEVSAWGGGNNEFQVYTPEKQNSFTRNGVLFLKPTLTADKFGEHFLRNGVLDLWKLYGRCTNNRNHGCRRDGKYGLINPIMSAKLVSRQSWKYGKVEVIAKMPRAIWMYPRHKVYGGWPRSGEIDMAECRGNRNYGNIGIHRAGSTMHWGLPGQNRFYMTNGRSYAPRGTTYADGFHKYVMEWNKYGIKYLIDDKVSLNAPTPSRGYWVKGGFRGDNIWKHGGRDAPFDQKFYIILNVAIGGTNGYFPDNVSNKPHPKPWRNSSRKPSERFWNAKRHWQPTWKGDDAAMQIRSVKVWQ